ncbi:NUDIX domain-containing protein [Actinospica robiniae]|uniref:NUDIX domain-containing protein n=1 Tax=Actinospica robiniae TaxID=304901 RepID=UPI00041B13DD|nr:NUDIX hydrolase [Actinospica robiniae]
MGTQESETRDDETRAGWLPIEQYIETIPHSTIHAAFYFTDEAGRPFGMRSSFRPDNWQFPGGDMDHGDVSPFAAAVRELAEETGMEFGGEPALLATLFRGPEPAWPGYARIGFLFDGGVLTEAQLAGIRLDPGEHDEWAVSPVEQWRTKASRVFVTCLAAAEQARATGRAAFLTA